MNCTGIFISKAESEKKTNVYQLVNEKINYNCKMEYLSAIQRNRELKHSVIEWQ